MKELSEKESEKYIEKAATAIDSKVDAISYAKLFDISIIYNDEKLQPDGPVKVEVTLQDKEKDIHPQVVHFGKKTEVLSATEDGNTVEFSTNSFSVFAVLGTEIIIAPNGEFKFENERYAVTVSYTEEAKIPLGTELTVTEITPEDDLYWDLWKQTVDKINEGVKRENPDLPDPRKGLTDAAFFDITLKYEGNKIEPAVPLGVRIEYKNGGILTPQNENTLVVHFAEEGTELIENVQTEKSKMDTSKFPGVLKNSDAVESFTYTQGSFSIVGTGSTGDYIEINDGNIDGQPMELYAPKLAAGRASSIAASKTVTDSDEDGIYELALNVTGASESSSSTTVNKSNVVIVIDTSGSMNEYVYNTYTYSADTYDESVNYYGVSEYGYFNVFYWPGGNYYDSYLSAGWYLNFYGTLYSYSGPVYVRQTRLQATKAAAVDLVDALLGNNKNETTPDGTSLNDIVEISLVTFAGAMNNSTNGYLRTYNNTHFTGTKNSTSASQLKSYINDLSAVGGTNWEQALKAAKTSADTYAGQAGENTAIIFLTDGKPTFYGSNDSGNGQEGDSNVKTCWNNAADDARNIVSAGYTLYNIFAFGTDTGSNSGSNYLKALTNYAYTGSGTYENYETTQYTRDYFFDAKDTAALTKAFQAIIDNINNTVGFGGVEYDDGVTLGVTNTSVAVDGTVHDESFRYTVRDSAGNIVYTVKIANGTATFSIPGKDDATDSSAETVVTKIDPDDSTTWITSQVYSVEVDGVTYKMSPASINATTGMVEWDLAGIGILQNGYTYTVAFDVWPNQYSYDLVADLNNGVKTLAQIKAELIAEKGEEAGTALYNQIEAALVGPDANGQYAVRTNYEQKVDYYTVNQEEDSEGNVTTTYSDKQTKDIDFDESIALTSKPLPMVKIWNSNLSPDQIGNLLYNDYPTNSDPTGYKVTLHVWKADTKDALDNLINQYAGTPAAASEHDYIEKTLGWNGTEYDWDDVVSIAPGTMVSLKTAEDMGIPLSDSNKVTYGGQQYYIIEKGHYYYVTEDNIDWHFELETVLYHPMLVDGRLKNVTFITDDEGNITGVEDIEDMTQVAATNSKTAELDITKKVVDNTGKMTQAQKDAETFTYKITLTVPKDADMSHTNALEWVARYNDDVSASNRYYVYGYQTSEDAELLGLADDVERFNQKVYGQYTVSWPGGGATLDEIFTDDGNNSTKSGTIYVTLMQNEIIRFTNLPAGTQYRIEEIYNNLYQANPSQDDVANLGANAPASNIEANGYAVTIVTKNGEPTVDERVVTGTIKELNKRYYNQFTNTLSKAIDVELKGTKHLDGYEWSGERYFFKLDKEGNAPLPTGHDRRTSFYLTNEGGTEDKTYSFGRIRFTEAGTYTYKVYETDTLNGNSIANEIKAVNGKAVQYGPLEIITIVVVDTDGVLSVDSVTNSSNHTVWDSDNLVATTTITNTVPKTNITASKRWLKADGTTVLSDLPKGTSVQFKLFADNEDTGKVVSLDGVTDENGESAAWVASFNDLASYKIVDGQPVLITYTVDEGVLPAGFERVTTGSVGNNGVIQNKLTTSTLSVSKTVTGNMGDKYKQFDFTLKLYEKAAETSAPVPLTDDDLVLTADQKKALKDEYDFTYDSSKNAWTFKLRNGQTIDIAGIPYGTYCNVEEDAANKEGYKTTYTISGTSSTLPRGIQLKDPATVAVENYRDSTVPTGIHTDSTIWRWLIGACFLMFFGSAIYGRRKRRQ